MRREPKCEFCQRLILFQIKLSWSPIQLLYGGEGDSNLYFDIALETDGGNPKLKIKSLSKLLAMMQENHLCDIKRIRNPDEKPFTW